MHRVFVYGTLRAGELNESWLGGAVHRGSATTAPTFTLVDAGVYPAALDYGRTPIRGDIYAVDAATFADLDTLEGYPVFYTRRRIITSAGEAWIYLWAAARNRVWPVIDSGDWPRYRRLRDQPGELS
ncbi:gamma-glutamylcyclotransferase family protein [Salinisphaera sp. RV14]|uniref:gamma-glutamylcyclotransferase family protein n=1 Tax=unclassified Salinisphaera TaxID=2649847 RepID=UPI003F83A29B